MSPRSVIRPAFVLAASAVLVGCGPSRIVERERYFRPVIRHVQPLAPSTARPTAPVAAAPDPSVRVLEGALADSRRELLELRLETMRLRDSLRVFSYAAQLQQATALALADKLAVLEQQMRSGRAVPAERPLRAAPEVRSEPLARREPARPVPSLRGKALAESEYSEGVQLFNRQRYDEAREWFLRLLDDGIVEDLADNCQYWVGECEFARGRWTRAVESFERVIALKGSNKRADAMLMLGRSYEQLSQTARARSMFQQVIREFPSSSAAATARWKLRRMPAVTDERTPERIVS